MTSAEEFATLARKAMIATGQPEKDAIETIMTGGERWTTDEARELFDFVGFAAPFVEVVRKADGQRGSLEFTHRPRFYFNFVPHEG